MGVFIFIILSAAVVAGTPSIRRFVITGPVFKAVKKNAPKISSVEQQAIEAGTEGFDRDIFSGNPDWSKFRALSSVQLTSEEQAFLDGPTRNLCSAINDWEVRGVKRDVPNRVWDIVKKHGFLGLRVSKKAGGHGFSAQAKSIILGMIASRSLDASITVAVPNSLGPDELLEAYGTEEQKKKYLKAFVSGKEIPAFAITSQNAGSDAASMRDVGYVVHGNHNGKEVLGVSVSWSKRYITLAPNATVLVLAFQVIDPSHLLGAEENRGITLALIPTSHRGVKTGLRHLPGGSAFPNGPTWGDNVFIPLEWIVGGEAGIGQGWKMIMQNLAAGRGISLPSMSAAAIKLTLLVSSAYARVRRQFNKPIGKIEGVQEPLARITEAAYIVEAARGITAAMVNRENRPLVLASILKYQATEYARRAVNDAMDIHGGKGLIDGPSNYLQSMYQIAPVAITVEGANIITRSLIIIGQAVLRSHRYFKDELEAFSMPDAKTAVQAFDHAVSKHVAHIAVNFFLSVFHNVTFGVFVRDTGAPASVELWYRKLSHASRRFSSLADIIILTYQGALKKKQYISGRFTDALAELYLLACVLKRFEDEGMHKEDRHVVDLCMQNGLYRFESAVSTLIENISPAPVRMLARLFVGTRVSTKKPAPDTLKTQVALSVLEPGPLRERLIKYTYIPDAEDVPIGLLEHTFRKSVEVEDMYAKVERAIKKGELQRHLGGDWIKDATTAGILSSEEAKRLSETEVLAQKVCAVDCFTPADVQGIKM